jgi:hypothetical protein
MQPVRPRASHDLRPLDTRDARHDNNEWSASDFGGLCQGSANPRIQQYGFLFSVTG